MKRLGNTAVRSALLAVLATAAAGLGAGECLAATFSVDSILDNGDNNPGDGVCDDGGGNCTLRAAIEEANALSGTDSISFVHSGATTFTPGSAYPTITDPIVIDGTTDPDFVSTPVVELDGTGAGAVDAIHITAGSSSVRGLVINRYGGTAIHLQTAGGNTVVGCYLGTDVNGTVDQGNTQDGILVDRSPNNTIGGTAAASRNVISGNDRYGVWLFDPASTGNQLLGNYIGTDANGTGDLGNSIYGVYVGDAPGNMIGGTTSGAGNVISGNDSRGVLISGTAATGNLVQGNLIGTDVTGTADLGNTIEGVLIVDAPNNTVGGLVATARNVISGNNTQGISIQNAGATGNLIQGNYIRC